MFHGSWVFFFSYILFICLLINGGRGKTTNENERGDYEEKLFLQYVHIFHLYMFIDV